jgi:hypothetical protein
MIRSKPASFNSAPPSDQFRTVGSHLNLTNLYVAHEAEPHESEDNLRRLKFGPVSGSFWESRYVLRRRILKHNRHRQLQ